MPVLGPRWRRSFAAAAGTLLRLVDRLCTVLYIAGTFAMAGLLGWYAYTRTPWLLLLAVPMLASAVLLAIGFHRSPELGLRLAWPTRRRRIRPPRPAIGRGRDRRPDG
ncbi:MAG: hypothetical protein ACFCUO_05060 [Rhodospirillales bacterium]